jgi:hypothetical protein
MVQVLKRTAITLSLLSIIEIGTMSSMDGKQQQSEDAAWQFKPGETISPRSQGADASPAETAAEPIPAAPQVTPATEPVTQPSPALQPPEATPQPELPAAANTPGEIDLGPADYATPTESLNWTASEFIAHNKTAGWHFGLIAATVLIAALLWFITKDWVTTGVVIFAGIMLSMYGARRPGEIQYQLDDYGLSIGQKHFGFNDFRAFSLVPEGAFASIALLPVKRFAPMTTLYFDPEDGDKILEILGNHLPQQPMKPDVIDSLMRRIRF